MISYFPAEVCILFFIIPQPKVCQNMRVSRPGSCILQSRFFSIWRDYNLQFSGRKTCMYKQKIIIINIFQWCKYVQDIRTDFDSRYVLVTEKCCLLCIKEYNITFLKRFSGNWLKLRILLSWKYTSTSQHFLDFKYAKHIGITYILNEN